MAIVPSSQALPAERVRDAAETIAKAHLNRPDSAGLAIAVVSGEEVSLHCFGVMERGTLLPIDSDTLFEIGSITKVFTTTILAQMVEEGRVNLDDPINKFLPPEGQIREFGDRITLLHLATHTSGLPRLPNNIPEEQFRSENPYATYTTELLYEYLRGIKHLPAPGRVCAYSNLGMGLLGHILSRVEGVEWEEMARRRVCEPLEMRDTVVSLSEEQAKRMAKGHDRGKPVSLWDIPVLSGAGALRSSIRDMARFLAANVHPDSSALRSSIERAQQVYTRGEWWRAFAAPIAVGVFYLLVSILAYFRVGLYGPLAQTAGVLFCVVTPLLVYVRVRQGLETMGLGWFFTRLPGHNRMVCWHNGGTGGFCSFLGFVRETGIGVVLLSNASGSVDMPAIDLLKALHRERERLTPR